MFLSGLEFFTTPARQIHLVCPGFIYVAIKESAGSFFGRADSGSLESEQGCVEGCLPAPWWCSSGNKFVRTVS